MLSGLFVLVVAVGVAEAADKTWDGEGIDPNWQTGANWDPTGGGGIAPVPNDSLFFGVSSYLQAFNDFPANTLFNSITFNSGLAQFELSGNSIVLNNVVGTATAQNIGGSITNNSANPQTIVFDTILASGKHLIVNNGAGHIVFDGGIIRNDGAVTHFLKTGAGDISAPNLANVNGIIGGWALFGTDWATDDGNGNLSGYNSYTEIVANGVIPSDTTANVKIGTGSGTATLQSNLTEINTLRYGINANETVAVGLGNSLRLGGYGGISRGAATSSTLTIGTANSSNGVFTAGGAANTDGEIVLDAGNSPNTTSAITINSQIADNGSGKVKLIKTGQASVTLQTSTSNNFSGGTYVAQGRLIPGNPNSLGSGGVFVSSGGQVYPAGGNPLITNDFFIAGLGTTEGFGFGAIRLIDAVTNSGSITLTGDARIGGGGTATPAKISGKITGNFSLELGSIATISGTIILSGISNDWSGDTTILSKTNGSGFNILRLGASEVIPNGAGKGGLFILGSTVSTSGGGLDLNGFDETVNGLFTKALTVNAFVTNGSATAATLTVGGNNATSTFGGNIAAGTGVINLTKIGTGALTLTNANTYTGNTLINSGALVIGGGGSIATSPVIAVNPGATLDVAGVSGGFVLGSSQTLKGSGAVLGTVRVDGTLAPGASVGTINTGDEVWSGGGVYTWEINDATGTVGTDPGWDLINVSGTLTITASVGSKFKIDITSLSGGAAGDAANFSNTSDYTWTILKTSTSISGFDPGVFNVVSSSFSNALPANGKFIVELANGGLDIVVKYVRAPSITSQPTNSTVAAGGSKTFYVAATGSGTLTYQWRKNGSNLSDGGNVSGATSSSLTLSIVSVSDTANYDVVVANSFGSVTSSTAGLNVTCPTITVNPSSLPSAMVGDTYSQTITASGGTAAYTFAVTSGSLPSGLSLSSGGTLSGTLTASAIYTFTVTATDAFGCTGSRSYTVAANITVTNAISAGYNLIANQLDRGGNTLNEIMPVVPDGCYLFKYDNSVGSYLEPALYNGTTATWSHGNIPLNPGEGAFLYSPTNFSLVFTGAAHVPILPLTVCKGYRLLSRQTNDIGSFDNIIGTAPSAGGGEVVYKWNGSGYTAFTFDGSVWVPTTPTAAVGESVWIYTPTGPDCAGSGNGLTAPPVITTQPQGQTVPIGANVMFTVVASGSGTLIYQWRLNGVNIYGETNASLSLNNVQPYNSGDYSVVVANAGGAVESKIAKLIVITVDGGFADDFTNSLTTNSIAGSVSGNNTNATRETGEPNHAGNTGGKSVWYAWQAPATGIATFSTLGSSFDTLLAVYTGTNVSSLKRVASDNDSGGYFASRVMFNAVAGTVYYIAMDGSFGASGDIVLTWSLEITADAVPEITVQPQNQAAGPGENVTLSVVARPSPLLYQWFQNGNSISGATNASYTITGLNVSKIGIYTVRVTTVPPREVFSAPASVQISTVEVGGMVAVGTFDKFLDSVFFTNSSGGGGGGGFHASGKKGDGDGVPKVAPAAGFTGTQIFNTTGSSKEPGEPNHCGEPGGASYWFSYQAPASGHMYINTSNSAYNTVLAIYRGPTPMTNFANLISVACDNTAGNGTDNADFEATNSVTYFIAVDGVGGSNGIADLNYNLVTAPPVVATHPQSRAVSAGTNGTLTVTMANSANTLYYQWQFNSTNLSGQTQSSYTRSNFALAHQGNYRVIVTNVGGSATGGPAILYLDTPQIRATNWQVNSTGYFQTQWRGPTNGMLIFQYSTNLANTNWTSLTTNTVTTGTVNFIDTTAVAPTNRFYRTRLIFP